MSVSLFTTFWDVSSYLRFGKRFALQVSVMPGNPFCRKLFHINCDIVRLPTCYFVHPFLSDVCVVVSFRQGLESNVQLDLHEENVSLAILDQRLRSLLSVAYSVNLF